MGRNSVRPLIPSQLEGLVLSDQALLPLFASPASIVLDTSINARIGISGSSVHALTKAALVSLVRRFRDEFIRRGGVNADSPGRVAAPLRFMASAA